MHAVTNIFYTYAFTQAPTPTIEKSNKQIIWKVEAGIIYDKTIISS